MKLLPHEESIVKLMKWAYERGISFEDICKKNNIENPFDMDGLDYQIVVGELNEYAVMGELYEYAVGPISFEEKEDS